MLLPGIYLWESGHPDMAEPLDVVSFQKAHPHFTTGCMSNGFGEEIVEIRDVGVFRKSNVETDSVVVMLGECRTTMEVARFLASQSVLPKWGVVVSTNQSEGRGQLRRHWVSPVGNLHMSVFMPPPPAASTWTWALSDLLSLVSGYVFSEVLGELGANISIKWPNDLIQGDRKVGGMLIEEQNGIVILGLGLNCVESPPDDLMREDRSVEAGILQTKGRVQNPLCLAETLVNRGESVYEVLLNEFLPSQFVTMLALRLAWLGRRVVVRESGNDPYHAVIAGISPQGGLVIRCDGGERILFSGSIFPL